MAQPPYDRPARNIAQGDASATVGRYQLHRVIGTGGMGSVYEATHTTLGLRVAIKTLKPALADNTITSTRFMREGVVAARIRHPNAVAVFDVLEEAGVSYLVMEYLEGETLKDLLDREQQLDPTRAVDLLLPVASAVAAAHDEGIVHRDLKPSNIFLARERTGLTTPKVLDFGLSWAADEERPTGDITRSGVVLGTLLYMAPEQVRNARQASAASDQYALGLILYQCLTGHRPFLRNTQYDMMNAIVAGEHPPPRALRPELPAALEALIERSILVDPAMRFPTMHAFMRALVRHASPAVQHLWAPLFDLTPPEMLAPAPVSSLPPAPVPPVLPIVPASTAPPPSPSWLERSPSRALLLGGVACVAALGLGVVIGASSRSESPPPRSSVTATAPAAPPPPTPAPAPLAEPPPVVATPPAVAPEPAPAVRQEPLVQQLRSGSAPPATPTPAAADGGTYVPGYSSPRYLGRSRTAPAQGETPPGDERDGDHH